MKCSDCGYEGTPRHTRTCPECNGKMDGRRCVSTSTDMGNPIRCVLSPGHDGLHSDGCVDWRTFPRIKDTPERLAWRTAYRTARIALKGRDTPRMVETAARACGRDQWAHDRLREEYRAEQANIGWRGDVKRALERLQEAAATRAYVAEAERCRVADPDLFEKLSRDPEQSYGTYNLLANIEFAKDQIKAAAVYAAKANLKRREQP